MLFTDPTRSVNSQLNEAENNAPSQQALGNLSTALSKLSARNDPKNPKTVRGQAIWGLCMSAAELIYLATVTNEIIYIHIPFVLLIIGLSVALIVSKSFEKLLMLVKLLGFLYICQIALFLITGDQLLPALSIIMLVIINSDVMWWYNNGAITSRFLFSARQNFVDYSNPSTLPKKLQERIKLMQDTQALIDRLNKSKPQ